MHLWYHGPKARYYSSPGGTTVSMSVYGSAMANTYSPVNIHGIFAVKTGGNIITNDFRDDLHRHAACNLRNGGSYPSAVCEWKDHVHTFFEVPVTPSISDQMRMLKATSSKGINDKRRSSKSNTTTGTRDAIVNEPIGNRQFVLTSP